MNYSIVKALILKDWYLQRWPAAGCLVGGVLALLVMSLPGQGASFGGTVLLITVMIIAGVFVAAGTVAGERKEQTLAFVMSLPVSSREYTASKLFGGAVVLLSGWSALMGGSIGVILSSGNLPDGLVPFIVVMLTELLASSFVLLVVALITESQQWTIAVMVTGNLFVNAFLYYVARLPAIQNHIDGPRPVWNETVFTLLFSEVGVIVLTLSLAFYFQGRKTDFL